MAPYLKPLPPVLPEGPQIPTEPIDGSVVRFRKGGGRYCYVAVRRGPHWETTATGDYGSIREQMKWNDLAPKMGEFEIAAAWSEVDLRADSRIREHLAVVRFTLKGLYLVALNIDQRCSYEGDWYTTITEDAEEKLPLGDYADWPQIRATCEHSQVVTAWTKWEP